MIADVVEGSRRLTGRQVQVLDAVAAGLSNKEIAARLTCSEHVIKWHVSNLLRRFGTSNRAGLVRCALTSEESFIGSSQKTIVTSDTAVDDR